MVEKAFHRRASGINSRESCQTLDPRHSPRFCVEMGLVGCGMVCSPRVFILSLPPRQGTRPPCCLLEFVFCFRDGQEYPMIP